MEALVIGLIATGNMYRQQKVSVPEPAKFEAFDLQALRLPDQKIARSDSLLRKSRSGSSYLRQTLNGSE